MLSPTWEVVRIVSFTHHQKVGGCDDFLESYFSF
jgi:hypothetical protein